MIDRQPFDEFLRRSGRDRLQNVHGTVTFTPEAIVRVEPGPAADRYAGMVADVRTVLGEALAAGKRLRCLGRRWSVSPVANTDGWMLDLSDTAWARWLGPDDLTPDAAADRHTAHLLVSGGASIRWVNRTLHRAGWSLQTTGASNGQAVAGAIATGTHGSAFHVGALHDTVAAIHVVVSPDEAWWVEPASQPAVSDDLIARLGGTPVRDDELFGALQTSLGSLGVVTGVVFRCVRNFWLQLRRYDAMDDVLPGGAFTFAQLVERLAAWEFDALLDEPIERIRHVDVIMNPYAPATQCYVSAYVLAEPPAGAGNPDVTGEHRGDEWSPDVLQFIGRLAGAVPGGPGAVTSVALRSEFGKPVDPGARVWGAWFTGQDILDGGLAISIGVDCAHLGRVVPRLLDTVQSKGRVPCLMVLRFVPGTSALLGMNRFERTCMIDVDGPYLPAMAALQADCVDALRSAGLPFTLHWGKSIDPLTRADVDAVYGDRAARWRAARARLLPDPRLARTFSHDLLASLVL